jgi:hypothetical protein
MTHRTIHQNPITVITPIRKDRLANIYEYLKEIKDDLLKGKHESFENIGTIHYCRWIVIDDVGQDNNPENQPPKLIFSSNFDGSIEDQFRDLCTKSVEIIDRIYDCCEGYPSVNERTTENRVAYLQKANTKSSAFYRGSPDRSLQQVLGESKLRNFLREVLDANSWDNLTAREVQAKLLAAVKQKPEFEWASVPYDPPRVSWLGMILFGLVLLALSPFIIIWVLIIRITLEPKDKNFTLTRSELNEKKMLNLESYEDIEFQNQFTQLVVMKPEKMRLLTFKGMMLFARVLIKLLFVKGKLMGIPTIHFARWVLFDNGKRVLFFSNFDGSWQQYLGDFIDKSGWGLTGIFSNTVMFPKTRFLFTGGAYDEEHFLAWSRNTELPTQIWYSAYPDLSIKNVNNNSEIRSLLFKQLNETRAQDFLKLL